MPFPVELEEDGNVRVIILKYCTFDSLLEEANLSEGHLFTYEDEDGDLQIVKSTSGLSEALCAAQETSSELRLVVKEKVPSLANTETEVTEKHVASQESAPPASVHNAPQNTAGSKNTVDREDTNAIQFDHTDLIAFMIIICLSATLPIPVSIAPAVSLADFTRSVSFYWLLAYPTVVAVYAVCQFSLGHWFPHGKIQKDHVYTGSQWRGEVVWAGATLWSVGALLYFLNLHKAAMPSIELQAGSGIGKWGFALGSTAAFFIAFDLFEYVLHRSLHSNALLYKRIHRVHHRFVAPSLLSGLAFHPIEGILFFCPLLALFWWPVHQPTFLLFFGVFGIIDLLAHAGYAFPLYERLACFVGTTQHHDYHHHHFTPNYGVYLSLWDHVCRTTAKSQKTQ